MKRYIPLILFFLLLFGFSISQKPQWKGTIEEENGVKVIKNPNEPLYGEISFNLEEDLSYMVEWDLQDTEIECVLFGDNYKISFWIEYVGKAFKELEKKAIEEAKKNIW
jgi:hypothetical protein